MEDMSYLYLPIYNAVNRVSCTTAGIVEQSMGPGTESEQSCLTGPPGYICWLNRFLGSDSAPWNRFLGSFDFDYPLSPNKNSSSNRLHVFVWCIHCTGHMGKKAVLFSIVLIKELLNFPGFSWGFEKEGTDIYVCTVGLFHHHFNLSPTFLPPPPSPPWVIADTYFPIWGLIPSPPERECLKDFFIRNKNFPPYFADLFPFHGLVWINNHSFLCLSKAFLSFHFLSFLVFHVHSFPSQPINVLFFPFVIIYIPCVSFSLGIM
jgi:hypothetical protein